LLPIKDEVLKNKESLKDKKTFYYYFAKRTPH
jgi:hypothetical protein